MWHRFYSTPYDGHDFWKHVDGRSPTPRLPTLRPNPPQRCRLTNMRSINRNR